MWTAATEVATIDWFWIWRPSGSLTLMKGVQNISFAQHNPFNHSHSLHRNSCATSLSSKCMSFTTTSWVGSRVWIRLTTFWSNCKLISYYRTSLWERVPTIGKNEESHWLHLPTKPKCKDWEGGKRMAEQTSMSKKFNHEACWTDVNLQPTIVLLTWFEVILIWWIDNTWAFDIEHWPEEA